MTVTTTAVHTSIVAPVSAKDLAIAHVNANFIIRDVQSADFEQVAALLNQNLKIIWQTTPYSVRDVAEKLQSSAEFLVAVDSVGQILSFISSKQCHPDSGFKTAQALSIYSSPKSKSSGVCSALLSVLIRRLRASGFRTLLAYIDAENAPSVLWHLHRGFQWAGVQHGVGDRAGVPRDLIVLNRSIGGDVCRSYGVPV